MPALPYSITISDEERAYLKSLIKTRTIQAQVVDRARMLLWKSEAKTDKAIADGLGVSVNTVRRCIDRYLNNGINLAIFDDERSGRPAEITDDAKSWIVSIACQKPCDLGYAAELWTLAALHKHIQAHAEEAGIQAVANKYPDYNPTEENGYIRRDYEYVRLGTLSLLAGIDLLTGEAIPLVSQTHKSSDFIKFLKMLNAKYPEGDTIRLILDNHSAHTSKETRQFLAVLPEDRFVFVFTPTHTSWLNMIESFFSKMTKQMLKGIRVNSKEELSERIYRYFDEINADPIVYHWTYKMDEIDPDEAATI